MSTATLFDQPTVVLHRADGTTDTRSQAACLDRAGRLAAALRDDLGVPIGANVGVLSQNSIEYLETAIAVAASGGRPVPINAHWTAREVSHIVADAEIDVLFTGDDALTATARAAVDLAGRRAVIVGMRADVESDLDIESLVLGHMPLDHVEGALAASLGLIYTSGTTGLPKGVARETMTPMQILSVAGATATRMGLRDGGRVLIPGPLYHTSPQAIATLALRMGASVILMERFSAADMLSLIDRYRVEHVKLVPTMLSRILSLPESVRQSADLSSLTHVVHSAAPCPPAIKRAAIGLFGAALVEFYGCTEAGTITWITSEEWLARPGSVGRPADGAAVRIVDEQGHDLPAGEPGHVLVRGADYWPRFRYLGGDLAPEFIDVGDIGYVDADGWLYLAGRSAEIVNRGGVNVYVAEIEAAAISHPGVEDAAAVGTPSDAGDLGEQIILFVVPRPGFDLDVADLAAHLMDSLASIKLPRRIVLRATLPRDDNGKLYRRRLLLHSVQ